MNTALYETYVQILHEELVPAMGCTETIAVAYAGALARQTLGALPERIELTVSGNIIKNVKSVIVPHTGGRKGLPVAVAAGVRVGDADAQLEVLANVPEDQLPLLDEYLSAAVITVSTSPLPPLAMPSLPVVFTARRPSGAATTMNATDMSITFTASNPGTYFVPYTITQGSIPSTGLARVEVQAVAGDAAKPIAANDVALLGADNTASVEPLANDVDPMGGVLSVTSVTADAQSGIKTGVVSNKRVYITARQVPTEPVRISYTVAIAAGSSTGVIGLQPPALTTSNSVPKAENISTQVRSEVIVSVDVLDHVTYSDGTTVSLQIDLQYDKNTC